MCRLILWKCFWRNTFSSWDCLVVVITHICITLAPVPRIEDSKISKKKKVLMISKSKCKELASRGIESSSSEVVKTFKRAQKVIAKWEKL